MYHVTIKLENVGYTIGQHRLFEGLTVTVPPACLLSISGANGSGKTSLLRLIAGIVRPTQGSISCENAQNQEVCHYLAHQNALKQDLSVRDNIIFWYKFGGSAGESPLDAATRLGLSRLWHLPVRTLSAGQQRRVALARFLVTLRPLWLWDEATTALDRAATALAENMAHQHLQKGGVLIAATHAALLRDLPTNQHMMLEMEAFHPSSLVGKAT